MESHTEDHFDPKIFHQFEFMRAQAEKKRCGKKNQCETLQKHSRNGNKCTKLQWARMLSERNGMENIYNALTKA